MEEDTIVSWFEYMFPWLNLFWFCFETDEAIRTITRAPYFISNRTPYCAVIWWSVLLNVILRDIKISQQFFLFDSFFAGPFDTYIGHSRVNYVHLNGFLLAVSLLFVKRKEYISELYHCLFPVDLTLNFVIDTIYRQENLLWYNSENISIRQGL